MFLLRFLGHKTIIEIVTKLPRCQNLNLHVTYMECYDIGNHVHETYMSHAICHLVIGHQDNFHAVNSFSYCDIFGQVLPNLG